MNSGIKLWNEAKKIIPGGNQLLSKRSEMFLPDFWPSYYKKAKGCEIWDLDGKKYYDFSLMGVCACILGYADHDVNERVKEAIDNGTLTTLNCYEEMELSRKLLSLHPWAEMVRFSKTGGEACVIGVRIARATTGKEKIAFCGYHGWHDWFLSSNLGNKTNLDHQLLPGLETLGVPSGLKNTAYPFHFNNLDELTKITEDNKDEIGVIIMEVHRSTRPTKEFLNGVRTLASEIGAVLIFDEVTSGFRENIGGVHLLYGVEPDIAIFGKALGNGYPISAVIGRKKFMDAAQETFISSTFWTERIGFVAALANIEKLEELDVPKTLGEYGSFIKEKLLEHAKDKGLNLKITGLKSLLYISFDYENGAEIQTYFTQEMLKRGFLTGSVLCVSYALSYKVIEEYLVNAQAIFEEIANILKKKESVINYLDGEVKHSHFKRLTD